MCNISDGIFGVIVLLRQSQNSVLNLFKLVKVFLQEIPSGKSCIQLNLTYKLSQTASLPMLKKKAED